MGKTITTLLLSVACAFTAANAQSSYTLRTLTFEDSDYAQNNTGVTNYWSNLIDSPQYGGQLLYGNYQSVDYHWYDKGNTELFSAFPENWNSKVYWGGGHAISNYWDGDLSNGDYEHQLSVYVPGTTANGQGGHGHNGSDNFCVHYGYTDNSGYSAENLPYILFADSVARTIDNMYVNISTYLANDIYNGDSLTSSLGPNDYVYIAATGYNGEQETTTLYFPLAYGSVVKTNWTKWDLSNLGDVTKVEFNVIGSSDNGYGFSQPAYFCYDDVSVRFPKNSSAPKRIIVSNVASDSPKELTVDLDIYEERLKGDVIDGIEYSCDSQYAQVAAEGKTNTYTLSNLPKNFKIERIDAEVSGNQILGLATFKAYIGDTEIASLRYGGLATDAENKLSFSGESDTFTLDMTSEAVSNDATTLTFKLSSQTSSMSVSSFKIYYTLDDSEEVPTGIENVAVGTQEQNVYYNLQGQRVANPTKGLYIVNGKKVLFK